MLKFVMFAVLVGSFAAAGEALARPGQCYTPDGRPTGPAYDAAQPDREWVRFVVARGGRCTGADEAAADPQPRFTAHETPNHRHLLRHQAAQRN